MISNHVLPTFSAFAFALSACAASTPPRVSTGESVMVADREFAAATKARRVDAWVEAFSADGVQLSQKGPVIGQDAIRALMNPVFADPNVDVEWHPVDAAIAPGGNLGYTWGRFKWTSKDEAGKESVSEGNYITVWKKQPDGAWKVVFDAGDPDPKS